MVAARALSAFFEERERGKGPPSARSMAGALLVAEGLDNLRVLARFVLALGKSKKR